MVAWSRLVSGESAIATVATSATHLHCAYGVTENVNRDMDDIFATRFLLMRVPCQDLDLPSPRPRLKQGHKSAFNSSSGDRTILTSRDFIQFEQQFSHIRRAS